MTDLMKRYEEETGRSSYTDYNMPDGTNVEMNTEDFYSWCIDEAERLNEENAKLKAQLTWRPVSEKPEEGQRVFLKKGTNYCNAYFIDGCFMELNHGYEVMVDGAYWLPIPPMEVSK